MPRLPQTLEPMEEKEEKNKNQGTKEEDRKESNGGVGAWTLVVSEAWENGVAIHPKYKLNNTENLRSNAETT